MCMTGESPETSRGPGQSVLPVGVPYSRPHSCIQNVGGGPTYLCTGRQVFSLLWGHGLQGVLWTFLTRVL